MSDSLDSYITNWASKYSGYKPFQLASASATDTAPAKSDTSARDTSPPPDPPIPPVPSGRADPSDPTSMPSSGPPPDPHPNTWDRQPSPISNPQPMPRPDQLPPPATPEQRQQYNRALPQALQPSVTPGGGQPFSPSIQQVAAQAQPPVQPVDRSGRNNPFNIRVPGTSRFQTYPTMQAGIDAFGRQIDLYQDRDGLNTIEKILYRYSPPNENPTELLIKRMVARTGIPRNQPINVHDPATRQKLYSAFAAQEGGGTPGVEDVKDELAMPRQYLVAATERDPGDRFKPDPSWNSDQPGMRPSSWDIPKIMSGPVPQLLALASIFARVPLTVALGAYGAMASAQQNGQLLEYQMQKDKWQTALKEHQAMESMEGQDVDEALMEFKDDPDGMQQAMMGIARRYNDPRLNQMAVARRFDQIDQLQKLRDKYNQPLQKMQLEQERLDLERQRIENERAKTQREQRDLAEEDAAVSAMDNQYKRDNPNATPDEIAIAHEQNRAKVQRDFTSKADAGAEEKDLFDVVGEDGKPTGQQVRAGKTGGMFDAETNKPFTRQPGQRLVPVAKPSSRTTSPQGEETEALLNAAKADVAALPNAPKEGTPEYAQALQAAIAKRKQEAGRQPAPHQATGFDIVGPDGHVYDRGVDLVRKPDGGYIDQKTGKDYVPPAGTPADWRAKPTTRAPSGGGITERIDERVINAGRQVVLHLQNAMKLSKGTTVGMFGDLASGVDMSKATQATLGRELSGPESQAMAQIYSEMRQELATAANLGMVPRQAAADAMNNLVPHPGQTVANVMIGYAMARQVVQEALETIRKGPTVTDEERNEILDVERSMQRAVPWDVETAIGFLRQDNKAETYESYAKRMGYAPGGSEVPKVGPNGEGYDKVLPGGQYIGPDGKTYTKAKAPD